MSTHPSRSRNTRKVSNIRFGFTCGSGRCCSSSAPSPNLIDYFNLHGLLRWSLIILFMLVKASCIVAIFMHMAWERLALKFAILIPPLCVLILIGLMAIEGTHTFMARWRAFVQ